MGPAVALRRSLESTQIAVTQLRLAAAAYLPRFTGASRYHTESGLRCYLAWCVRRHSRRAALRRKTTSTIASSPIASARCTATLTGTK